VIIRKIPIDQINPAAYNPRKDLQPGDPEYEKLKRSMQEFGYVEPIVWNERTGNVVGGHQRYKVLLDMGMQEVDCVVVELDEEKEKALNIALNKIQGDWDYAKLKDLLEELDTGTFDIELTGFGLDEIEQLLTDLSGGEEESKNGVPQVEARAALGDIWQLGEHKIACGDCNDIVLLERLLDGKKINTIITSPPYAQQRKEEYGGIPAEEYPDWFGSVANAMWAILDDTGSFFVNIKEHVENGQRSLYVMKMVIAMVEKYGWRFVDELIWTKPGLPGGWKNRLKNDFEPVFWFAKTEDLVIVERQIEEGAGETEEENVVDEYGRTFHFCKQQKIRFYPKNVGKPSNRVREYTPTNKSKTQTGNIGISGPIINGIARPGNVIHLQGNKETWEHPAMYPVGLPEFLIKLTTLRGDTVFDPFLGAGSTLIAAEKTKRICYGTELQPQYVDIVLARWELLTRQKAVKISAG
jgi:DNA modification methylase